MTPSERKVRNIYIKKGFIAFHNGYPDFLFYRKDGNIAEFVEVKSIYGTSGKPPLSKAQKRMHEILEKLGFKVKIIYVRYGNSHAKISNLRERINKLVQEHYSYREIAAILGMKSHQLVNYHFKQYRKLTAK